MADKSANYDKNKSGLWPLFRDVGLLGLGVLIDRTVTYKFPSLIPALPYLWLVVAVWVTREIIDKTSLRGLLIRLYSGYEGKRRMMIYGVLFVSGGSLLCFYWWGINRILRPSPEEQLFSVEIRTTLISEKGPITMFMVANGPKTISPIFYLTYLQITNLQDVNSTVSELKIAIGQQENGPWENLVPMTIYGHMVYSLSRVPGRSVAPKTLSMGHGTLRLAEQFTTEDLKGAVIVIPFPAMEFELSKPISAHSSVVGWIALDSLRREGLSPGQMYFKITLRDSANKTGSYIASLPRPRVDESSVDINVGLIQVPGPVEDISSYDVRYAHP